MLQRLRVLAHAHNPHCARRIGQLRMQQADGAVQVLGTMSSQFSLHSRLVHNVRVDMNHACKQLAIVNSSSFSTPAIPEESPQSRRWDADFHAFVCRVVAVRTDDILCLLIRAVHILEMVLNRACSISINYRLTLQYWSEPYAAITDMPPGHDPPAGW